nr:hypothetical protein [Tanacetum cinerariifolium]
MPMDPLDPYVQLVMGVPPSPDYIPRPEAPPSPDYIPGPEAPPSPDYIPGAKYPEYLPPADDMFPAEEQPLLADVSPTAESPGYITKSEPEMEPEENDGDDEKSEGDSIDYPTSEGDNDANDDGDDLSEDDADDEDEEESSNSEEEKEEHLAPTVPTPALYSSVSESDKTEPFEEGETAATPPPLGYRVAARISVQPHILMPFLTRGPYQYISDSDRGFTEGCQYPTEVLCFLVIKENGTKEKDHEAMIDEGVNAALAARDATRNGDNSHTLGTGARRPVQAARECSYSEFLKYKPLDFKGTEGVVELTRWFEKMESVFSISNWTASNQVKFATCTLQDDTLTWWNSHVKTTTPEAAYAMTWATLKKTMTGKYCPRGEIKKIETEMWNLKVKGTDVVAYNRRFQQLALMCSRMFPEEIDKIEKYIDGLPDMILGSVKASRSKTMQEVIEFTTELMEDKTRAYAERQADNKRKSKDLARNNQNQQPYKRKNTGQAYTAGNGDKRLYAGSRPLCSKCNYNHEGHFKRNCPKLKNNDRGNQAGNNRAPTSVYAVGNAGANPDNVVA